MQWWRIPDDVCKQNCSLRDSYTVFQCFNVPESHCIPHCSASVLG